MKKQPQSHSNHPPPINHHLGTQQPQSSPNTHQPNEQVEVASFKTTQTQEQPLNKDETQSNITSYAELTKYQRYLQYKLQCVYLVKRTMLEMITIYESLAGKSYLKAKEMHLLLFLLDTLEYVNNQALIFKFKLSIKEYQIEESFSLFKDIIDLSKISKQDREKIQLLKLHYLQKFQLINQKYRQSVKSRVSSLEEEFKSQIHLKILQKFLDQLKVFSFPQKWEVHRLYLFFFNQIKAKIYPDACQNIPKRELILFYLWYYLISFYSVEEETFQVEDNYLQAIKLKLFGVERKDMIIYLFETMQSPTIHLK